MLKAKILKLFQIMLVKFSLTKIIGSCLSCNEQHLRMRNCCGVRCIHLLADSLEKDINVSSYPRCGLNSNTCI